MCATHPSNFNHFRQPTLSKVSNMGYYENPLPDVVYLGLDLGR